MTPKQVAEDYSMYDADSEIAQLEDSLQRQIYFAYFKYLGHRPGTVRCRLFDKNLAIFIEDAITKPEQLLSVSGYSNLAVRVRNSLNEVLQPSFRRMLEEALGVRITDFLIHAHLNVGSISITAVLDESPALHAVR